MGPPTMSTRERKHFCVVPGGSGSPGERWGKESQEVSGEREGNWQSDFDSLVSTEIIIKCLSWVRLTEWLTLDIQRAGATRVRVFRPSKNPLLYKVLSLASHMLSHGHVCQSLPPLC